MILKISMYFLSLMAVIFLNFAGASAASSGSELSCNAENGKKVFKKCAACHSVEKTDKHKTGPNLLGLAERTSGTIEGFKFSRAMRDASIVWNEESLKDFLEKPRKSIPRNRMAFSGIKDSQDRADVVCFILNPPEN